jgi:hypothetical protein
LLFDSISELLIKSGYRKKWLLRVLPDGAPAAGVDAANCSLLNRVHRAGNVEIYEQTKYHD